MNSYFEQLELESVALEAAIGAYEAENGLTEEYLSDYSTRCDYATESAYTDDDDFGFGLFGDMAPATEEAESDKGSGIGRGIKNILSAVGRFFTKIKDGIVAFFQSFKKKKTEVKDVEVAPAAEKVATSLRGSIKQTLGIISNVTKEDTIFIRDLCRKINDAISAATKGPGNSIKSYKAAADRGNKANKEKSDDEFTSARDEKYAKIGSTFRKSYGDDETESNAAAMKDLEAAEGILTKVTETRDSLKKATDNLQKIFAAEVAKAYKSLTYAPTTEHDISASSDSSLSAKREKAISQQGTQKELDDFNAEQKKRSHLGNVSANGNKEIAGKALINQIKQKLFIDYDLTEINNIVGEVVKACETHSGFCKTIADKKIETDNADAKIAYKMCKVLSNASNVYTDISTCLKSIISGTVFHYYDNGVKKNITDPDGNGILKINTGKRSDATKEEQDFLNE